MKQQKLETILFDMDILRRSEPPCSSAEEIDGEEWFKAEQVRGHAEKYFHAFHALVRERKDLRLALRALLDMVAVIGKSTRGMAGLAAIHGMEYDGPTFEEVIQWCREALGDQEEWNPEK